MSSTAMLNRETSSLASGGSKSDHGRRGTRPENNFAGGSRDPAALAPYGARDQRDRTGFREVEVDDESDDAADGSAQPTQHMGTTTTTTTSPHAADIPVLPATRGGGDALDPQGHSRERSARSQKLPGARRRKGKKKKPRRTGEITTMVQIADPEAVRVSNNGCNPFTTARFFAQPDFDAPPAQTPDEDTDQLYLKRAEGEMARRKYNFDGSDRIDFRDGANTVPKGVTPAQHSKTWEYTTAKATQLVDGEFNFKPMDYGKPGKRMFIPGDLARCPPASIMIREQSRFIRQKDWAVLQAGKEAAGKGPSVVITSPEPESTAFLTQGKEEEETVPDNPARPWEGRGGGTYKPRGDVPAVKALKAKPFFNPTTYITRQKTRLLEEAQRRVELVAAGENPNVVNQLKFRVRAPTTFVVKPKASKLWHTAAVKAMLDQMIKVENIKLRALDELLEDLGPKGSRANMMDERLAPLRFSIKGVRNRITHHREAKNLVTKQSWYEDLKQLKIGGSNGLSLDIYLSIVSDMHMEDQLEFVDDTP